MLKLFCAVMAHLYTHIIIFNHLISTTLRYAGSDGLHGWVDNDGGTSQQRLHFFTGAQIAEVVRPMLFKWATQLGPSG